MALPPLGVLSLLAALHLVLVHTVDGKVIAINPAQITSMHAGTGSGNKLVTGAVRCVVMLTDGKFVGTVETCDEVRKLLEKGD